MYPKEIKLNEKVALKLGIKSSLPKAKECIGLLYLIWKSSGQKFEYIYTKELENKVLIRDDILNNILNYLESTGVLDIERRILEEKINNNYLFKSHIESLKVAFELVWKICIFEFEDKSKPYSAERTGGIRYNKKIKFTKNMDIIDTIIITSEKEYLKVLYNWIIGVEEVNKDIEASIITILSLMSEEAIYRIRISQEDEINFNMSGIYEVLKDEKSVIVSDYKENMGSLRILHTILKEGLNPYIKKEGSKEVRLKENIDETFIKNYSERINAYFDLSRVDLDVISYSEDNNIDYEESKEDMATYEENRKSNNDKWTQKIYFGPPGTGKSYNVSEEILEHQISAGLNLEDNEEYNSTFVYRTTIYPEYNYYDFIGNIMPVVEGEKITYNFKPGVFTLALSKALDVLKSNIPVYLVIEEMSRGNIASVFGDIFQLLDRDENGISEYRIDNDIISDYLSKEQIAEYQIESEDSTVIKKEIYLPSNLNILGTVNTSDQNVFVMDTAFKRRFEFEYVDIEPIKDNKTGEFLNEYKFELGKSKYSWNNFYVVLNNYIVTELDLPEDKQIGQFFIKFYEDSPEENDKQIQNKLLLYLWEDIELIKMTENKLFDKEYKSFSSIYKAFKKGINVFHDDFLVKLTKIDIKDENIEENINKIEVKYDED